MKNFPQPLVAAFVTNMRYVESLPLTSDIKMIDFWLIFCQLVPFSEVVLVTAIEYLRVDQKDKETNNVDPKLEKAWEAPERQRRDMHLLILKTIGRYHLCFQFYKTIESFFFAEKKGLPAIVVLSFLAYSSVAVYFYFYG